ncbi:metallophosphoesterase family protein [Thomasclavelia sp.]|uniref:metallophosphoesterase family protein n=1 Tax=Thomasclavelia sp. TaxID=3025757 RepID=UPI0025CD72DA|nr:metallophosphoesterase family protein [Thomasclavelia sp.]
MFKIGIISDTHDVLKEAVLTDLKDCDYIIHAGDITKQEILDKLKQLAPVYAVKGNNDKLLLNTSEEFSLLRHRFYLIHELDSKKNVDFYIYGHSHQLACYQKGKTLYLNPGSCGRKRFSLPLTYIILYLSEDSYEIIIKKID